MESKISRVRFSDVDHFTEMKIDQGWNFASTQLSAGANEIGFDHFAFPELLVGHYCSRQSIQTVFTIPDGTIAFLICRDKLPMIWCGRHLPPTLLGVLRSAREHWTVLPAGLDCYEFTVSEDLIARTEILPRWFFDETARLDLACVPLNEPITGQFLQRLDSSFDYGRDAEAAGADAVESPRFFDCVIDGLLQLFDDGLKARGTHRLRSARRVDLVTQARDFVAANLTAVSSADDMARALGVSYRVLNYAFRDSLGMSPYQYLLTEKLHSARRRLKSSDASVAEVCVAHGFHSPGRFAAQYARLFGELPSRTRVGNGPR